MEIRKLNHNTYDIFLFQGWEGWTRVKVTRNGVFGVAGKRISHALFKHLSQVLVRGFVPQHGRDYNIVI